MAKRATWHGTKGLHQSKWKVSTRTSQGKAGGEHLDACEIVPVQLVELGRRGGGCCGRLVRVVAPQQAVARLPLALPPACHVPAESAMSVQAESVWVCHSGSGPRVCSHERVSSSRMTTTHVGANHDAPDARSRDLLVGNLHTTGWSQKGTK